MKLYASLSSPPIGGVLTARYAKIPNVSIDWGKETSLEVSSELSLDSSITISRYLARRANNLHLYGADIIQQTEIDHWLSFTIGPLSCSQEFMGALNYLESTLSHLTYLVGNSVTIADLNVYGALLVNQSWIKLMETGSSLSNVKRWFTFISKLPDVKQTILDLPSEVAIKTKKEVRVEMKDEGKFVELPGAEMGKVVVRFPPEASGYLHIGHAKAALLNWYYKELFNGTFIMRFDDTNPDKEKADFEKVILEDVKLLEIKPDKFTYTSDHFPLLLNLCEQLLKSGKAYVDDTPAEQMKVEREARQPSRNRENNVEKNLNMWAEMVMGSDFGTKCCVRAKIDMSSDNGCMRDPTIYRCKNESHPKTGNKYKVYPTYDFACPIVDSIEGVTHALRTMEYHDRDDQYYWFIDVLNLRKPHIWEYSRLNMMNTVLSKRKLTWFVEQGLVESWEDPRFPTVRGVLRRGLTVEGLKQFIIAQGSSRSVVQMEWDKIWAFNKKIIDPIVPRYTALELGREVVVNVRGAKEGTLTVPKHPKNISIGNKTIEIGPKVLIESADAEQLVEGENATFINWGNLKIIQIRRDGSGRVSEVDAELNLSNTDFKKTLKLTWLAQTATSHTNIQVLYFDHIITKPVLGKDEDFKQYINHNSKKIINYIGDPELTTLKTNELIQLQRIGYFRVDAASGPNRPLILIHIPDGSSKGPAFTSEVKKAASPPLLSVSKPALVPLTSAELEAIADQWRVDREALQKELPSVSADRLADLNYQIQKQGQIVRDLKSTGGNKASIQDEVSHLLALKADYKSAAGVDWAPGITLPCNVSQTDLLNTKIESQGNKVRQLKAQKASKGDIDSAVEILLSLKKDYKNLTGKEWKASSTPPPVSISSEALSTQIADQGNKVRELKASKTPKAEIEAQVKILLLLKQEYKKVSGEDWKPATQTSPVNNAPPAHDQSIESLSNKIAEVGNTVRQLKTAKAPKAEIDASVKVLLSLKQEYKTASGQEWKPMNQTSPESAKTSVSKKIESVSLSDKITEQGNIVRQLKANKSSKNDIDAAVKVLLALKQEYKTDTGEDWKPNLSSTVNVTPNTSPITSKNNSAMEGNQNNAEKINSAINQQGDKIRKLKAEKADKEVIDKEVKDLLNLKAEYKSVTGKDWQPVGGGNVKRPQHDKKKSDKPVQEKKDKEKSIEKEKLGDDKGVKKQTRLGLEAKKEENLPDWYSQVITKGELIEYYDVSGCYILRPWAYSIWEAIQSFFDKEIKKLGVVNAYFPMFVSRSVLEREKAHIADFAPEVAWVTKSGDSDLAEHIAIRPTSETAMYPAYSKWIQSHRDLPLRLNQWNNVVRWEFKHPQPFLRTREFLWQEGHTAFATYKEAEEEVYQILDLYARIYTDLLAVPVVKGRKTEKEKFAGGDYTTTVEAFIPASGRGIQGATSHHLGHNFAKMFDISVENPENKEEKMYVFQNSWGITTRTIGVMIMVHADNQGLVLPPNVAALQVVIVPCGITANLPESIKANLVRACKKLDSDLKAVDIRSKFDERDNYSPGWKFNDWELKGVPIRIEFGPKDLEKNQLVAVRRDNGVKSTLSLDSAIGDIRKLLNEVHSSLYAAAEADLKSHTKLVTQWSDFCPQLDAKNILLVPFCETTECEDNIKRDSTRDQDLEPGAPAMGAKSLCIPLQQPQSIKPSDRCIYPSCNNPPKSYTLFGRSY